MSKTMRTFLAGFGLILILLGAGVFAQETTPDQSQQEPVEIWDVVADRAEQAIDNDSETTAALEALRSRVADFRSEFDEARKGSAARIEALREQIEALGPLPEGENALPEAQGITDARDRLNEQLNAILVPVQEAERDFVRADGLIREIDTIIRDRQTDKFLSLTPSPLNPKNWALALEELSSSSKRLLANTHSAESRAKQEKFYQHYPGIIGLGLLGLVLCVRGHVWARRIVNGLRQFGGRGLGIWSFLVSLLRIVLPLLGVTFVVIAALQTGYLGPRGSDLMSLLPFLIGFMLGFRWVSDRVFSRNDDEALILLSQEDRRSARLLVNMITIIIIINVILAQVVEYDDPVPAILSVVNFPFTLLSGLMLFQLGRLMRGYSDVAEDDETPQRVTTYSRFVRGVGLGAMAVGIASPIAHAIGYQYLSDGLLRPYTMTMAILGFVAVLQRFAADVYDALTGQGVKARDALFPVLFGMILLLAATPLLALVWGARTADLTELWAAFERGIPIGETRISPTDIVAFLIIFAIGFAITRIVQSALRNNVLPKTRIDIGGQNAIVAGFGYVGIFLAALAAITGAGIDLSSLAIVAGALSVGIGFGLQTVVSNFVSGIILLVERPISEGDWIEVGGQMGYVRDISVRSTRIETFDRTDVIVPNADLVSGTVTNFTRGNTLGRAIVPVGVAYGTDTQKVDTILREIANAQPMVLGNPPPNVLFMGFGADALEFEIRAFLRDVNWIMLVKSDINHAIAKRFADEGIEIPFAQRDLWLRNPEVLRAAGAEPPPEVVNTDLDTSNARPKLRDNNGPDHDGSGDAEGEPTT